MTMPKPAIYLNFSNLDQCTVNDVFLQSYVFEQFLGSLQARMEISLDVLRDNLADADKDKAERRQVYDEYAKKIVQPCRTMFQSMTEAFIQYNGVYDYMEVVAKIQQYDAFVAWTKLTWGEAVQEYLKSM